MEMMIQKLEKRIEILKNVKNIGSPGTKSMGPFPDYLFPNLIINSIKLRYPTDYLTHSHSGRAWTIKVYGSGLKDNLIDKRVKVRHHGAKMIIKNQWNIRPMFDFDELIDEVLFFARYNDALLVMGIEPIENNVYIISYNTDTQTVIFAKLYKSTVTTTTKDGYTSVVFDSLKGI
jgi:hypothetical protein